MTAKINLVVPYTRTFTAEEIAQLFCALDNEEMAEFFNAVSEQVDSWDRQFCFQLQAVVDSCKLNAGGITIMREIGEYGEDAMPKPAKESDPSRREYDDDERGDRQHEIRRDAELERQIEERR